MTAPAVNTVNWQTLTVQNPKAYRYIRIYNGGQWFGNLAEVKFYGTVIHTGSPVLLDTVSLKSDNPEDSSLAVTGNTVTLDIASGKALENVKVYYGDKLMETASDDKLHWKARYTVGTAYQTGKIPFVILYDNGPVVTGTTDGTSVTIIDPLQIALDNAAKLEAGNYSRLSYYQFNQEVERIKAEMTPGYFEMKLAKELYDAKSLLAGNPVSLYSFEGNADNAFGSANGTVSGTPAYKDGKVGKAIELNGTNSYVTLPAAHPLSSYNQITVSTWVNWKGGNQWQRIFDFGNGTNQYMFLSPRSGNNTLRFAIKNGGGEQIVQTSQLAENTWVHVAVTLGNGTAKLYVNGVEQASANVSIKPSDFKPTLNYIGKSQFSDPLLSGMLDEFRIYDHVLSADEILQLANNTAPQGDNSLLAYLLDKAAVLDFKLYTESSWQAVAAAVENAKVLATNANQAAIDASAAQLQSALDALMWMDVSASVDPSTPSGKNGWYTSPVTVTLSPAEIAEYSLDGGATWAVYGAPVTLDADGTHQVQYRRSVDSGEAKNLEIKIDRTAPVVQITGAASYTIDQDVAITCSATDVVSSVYGTPCGTPLVQAKAYTLPAGQNTVSVTAEDMAGNQTTVTHTYTVTVTFDSLKKVTTSFLQATNAKGWDNVASSLNKLLDQAKAKAAVGQTAAAKDIMADYIGQITDQTGKSFTKAQADILIRWARIVI